MGSLQQGSMSDIGKLNLGRCAPDPNRVLHIDAFACYGIRRPLRHSGVRLCCSICFQANDGSTTATATASMCPVRSRSMVLMQSLDPQVQAEIIRCQAFCLKLLPVWSLSARSPRLFFHTDFDIRLRAGSSSTIS